MLKNPTLLRLLIAQLLSVIGDGAYFVAVAWWLKTTTGSDAQVGLLALGESLAAVVCGPLGGVLADRWDRRRLMLGSDAIRAVVLIAPLALLLTHQLEPWHVIASGVALTAVGAGFGPAVSAALPTIVAREGLPAANSASQICFALGAVLGPALGGVLVGAGGSAVAVGANLVSFLASAALLSLCRLPANAPEGSERASLWSDLTAGLRFFAGAPTLLGLLLLSALLNFILAPLSVLLPALAYDVLHTDARGFGVLQAMIPAGFIVGGIAAPLLKPRRIGPAILGLACAAGAALTLLSMARQLEAAALLLGVMGVLFSATNLLAILAFQTRIPSALQGRAFGAVGTLSQGLRPAGIAVGTAAIAAVGPTYVTGASGILLALGALCGGLVPGIFALTATPTEEA